jgi:3-hydroxymyristoyl/3-hydroxydecanoyl-(acyl carrier protein) dehydratase
MLDQIHIDRLPNPPDRLWGRARVNPGAWFFSAHFPQDPVWPGSLGLEAFIEAAKVLASLKYYPGVPLKDVNVAFTAPLPMLEHKWLYRGQIVPMSRECVLAVQATAYEEKLKLLAFKGLLWVDDLPIYEISDFTVSIRDAK